MRSMSEVELSHHPRLATRRHPWVSPSIVAVCAATLFWVVSLEDGGHATRYTAVPISVATFLLVQLLVPRARWDRDRVLGPGNVAALVFALQLVVIPTLLVVHGPSAGTLGAVPSDNYVNQALLLQAAGYVCYAGGYVAWSQPVRPRRLLAEPNLVPVIGMSFVVVGAVGLALAFPSVGALVDYFTGRGDIFGTPGPTSLTDAAATFLRPFLAYGLIILWAARIARRRPGARLQPVELGLIAVAVAASATYSYNRGSVVVPLMALVTAYSCFGRRQSPARIMAMVAVVAVLAFLFGEYRETYSGTQGGAINPAEAGLDRPGSSFADEVQVYGNGPQFWAVAVQEVDRTGLRHGESVVGSVMFPVPVLGAPFRESSGPTVYNQLIYGQPDISDQNLGFGAELYWNFGIPGVIVGYFLLGFAVRRFDDRVEASADALAAYSWSYCGIWVALLAVTSISVLAQIITYFFWPVIAMFVIARMVRPRPVEAQL